MDGSSEVYRSWIQDSETVGNFSTMRRKVRQGSVSPRTLECFYSLLKLFEESVGGTFRPQAAAVILWMNLQTRLMVVTSFFVCCWGCYCCGHSFLSSLSWVHRQLLVESLDTSETSEEGCTELSCRRNDFAIAAVGSWETTDAAEDWQKGSVLAKKSSAGESSWGNFELNYFDDPFFSIQPCQLIA